MQKELAFVSTPQTEESQERATHWREYLELGSACRELIEMDYQTGQESLFTYMFIHLLFEMKSQIFGDWIENKCINRQKPPQMSQGAINSMIFVIDNNFI